MLREETTMKNHVNENKKYSFHSISSPGTFLAILKETAIQANFKVEETDKGFDLQLDNNHGGYVVYSASLMGDENGKSLICGEIVAISQKSRVEENKKWFSKLLWILGGIVLLPITLMVLLCVGIYVLFYRMFHKKFVEPTEEEMLCEFMINKMCCRQIDDEKTN